MQFIKVSSPAQAAKALAEHLQQELTKGQRVLWLVSGGSNIPLSVQVMKALSADARANLAIMLTDERFGPESHPDSNMRQLLTAGLQPGSATVVPTLLPGKQSLEDTRSRYDAAIQTAFQHADVIVGQFGMGADGHIAGILPGSPAVNSTKMVEAYDGGDFIRITLTPHAIKHITAAYLFAFGEGKQKMLATLHSKDLPVSQQPAQILKQLSEAYVYNDQIGERQ